MKTNNIKYIYYVLFPLGLVFGLYVLMDSPLILKLSISAIFLLIAGFMLKKIWHLPRPLKDYGNLEPIEVELPGRFGVALCTSEKMDSYRFLNRNIEILSPLFNKKDSALTVVISPTLFEKIGLKNVKIGVVREIIKYQSKTHIKTIASLFLPFIAMVILVELYFVTGFNRIYSINEGAPVFFVPLVITIYFVATLLIWNKYVSKIDFHLDCKLVDYFSKEDIVVFIEVWDQLYYESTIYRVGNTANKDRRRKLEKYYITERIGKLKDF